MINVSVLLSIIIFIWINNLAILLANEIEYSSSTISATNSLICSNVTSVKAFHMPQYENKCLFYIFNPNRASIALLKVIHDVSQLEKYRDGYESFLEYANEYNYALLVYRASPNDWEAAKAPHFSKIIGIKKTLEMHFDWVFFSDMDTIVINGNMLQRIIDHTPSSSSLVLMDDETICSCNHLWRKTEWTMKFLDKWMTVGEKGCCQKHPFDQLALWGALLGIDNPVSSMYDNSYRKQIKNLFNPNVYLSYLPYEATPWNKIDPDVAPTKVTKSNNNTVHFNYRLDLGYILERENAKIGAELGVQRGAFASRILRNWKSAQVYVLCDVWKPLSNYKDLANVDVMMQEKIYQDALRAVKPFKDRGVAVEVCRNLTTICADQYKDKYFDFIYIDARHDFKGVYQDLQKWWPKLKDGGIFAGHDYVTQNEGPAQNGQDWTKNYDGTVDKTGTVVKGAVNLFAQEHNLTVTSGKKERSWPSWAIRKPILSDIYIDNRPLLYHTGHQRWKILKKVLRNKYNKNNHTVINL